MKMSLRKRLVAGGLAVLMMFGNASEILAANLESTEIIETIETVTTEEVEPTESVENIETIETIETTESSVETEVSEDTELLEATESSEVAEALEVTEMVEVTEVVEEVEFYTTSALPAVENLTVTMNTEYGSVVLSWDCDTQDETIGFEIYRLDEGASDYSKLESGEVSSVSQAEDETYSAWAETLIDQTTGNTASATFRVVPVNAEGETGTPAEVQSSIRSAGTVTNPDNAKYTGICYVDEDGNEISALNLHVGEAKKVGIALKKADGSIIKLTDMDYHTYMSLGNSVNYQFAIDWTLIQTTDVTLEHASFKNSGEFSGEYIDWLFTEETFDQKEAYFKANAMLESGMRYFAEATVLTPFITDANSEEYTGEKEQYKLRLPITVEAAEEDVTYTQPEQVEIMATKEDAYQQMRDLMVARDNTGMVVTTENLFDNSQLDTMFDVDVVFDMYKERNGMKAYEGDYLQFTVGDVNSYEYSCSPMVEYYDVTYKDVYYDLYQSQLSFVTTREQEAEVDEYVNNLIYVEGGALYEYRDASDREKVNAIYNFIVGHVNPNVAGNRREPIYHTAWHALFEPYGDYAGSGTCQAFAMLFTRISREMGIPSKVIMGTDPAAHAYNIVKVDGSWYYIDTNSRRGLSTATEFTRAEEQYMYQDSRYIKNYLSKIEGNNYNVEAIGVIAVSNSENEDVERFETFEEANAYVSTLAEANSEMTFVLTFEDGDIIGDTYGDFGEYASRVTINLDGNTLFAKVTNGNVVLRAAKVQDGIISVDKSTLYLYELMDSEEENPTDLTSIYENVDFKIKANSYGNLWMGSGQSSNKLFFDEEVTFADFDDLNVHTDVEINSDINVRIINANMDQLDVNGMLTVTNSANIFGNIHAEKLVLQGDTTFNYGSALKIYDRLVMSGTTRLDASGNLPIVLVRKFETEDSVSPLMSATMELSGAYVRSGEYVIDISAQDYVGDELQENTAFKSGDILGTINKFTVDGAYINSQNLSEYIRVNVVEGTTAVPELDGTTLAVLCPSVTVTAPNGASQTFSSMKKAIDGLGAIANSASGTYTFTFIENVSFNSNITMPSYVKDVILTSNGENITVDFRGYTLKTAAKLTLTDDLRLVNDVIHAKEVAFAKADGTYRVNTITTTGALNLPVGSTLEITGKAAINNLKVVEGGEGATSATITAMPSAEVVLNGSLTVTDEAYKLCYGVAGEDGYKNFVANEKIFTTNMKKFPIELVELKQNASNPRYTALLQVGTVVRVVGEWYVIKAQQIDGSEEVLKSFTTWKEASAYITTLSNAGMTYIVEIAENLDLEETLSMPSKAKGIIFRGTGGETGTEQVTLNYNGDVKLVTTTTFENIEFSVKKLTGKDIELKNATISASGSINVANVISSGEDNQILYGGNASSNILTITGTVTGTNPITVTAKAVKEAGYKQGSLLLNAKKASPAYFKAEASEGNETGAVYKNADKIYYGVKENATITLKVWDAELGDTIELGSYGTIAEVFAEIDRLGDKTAEYQVYLSADMDSASVPKTINTPANAKSVTVYSDAGAEKTIYFGQQITMKSPLALKNIKLAPTTAKNTISLGNYSLYMENVTAAGTYELGSITGSDVTKASYFVIKNYEEPLVLTGDLKNIECVQLNNSKLEVNGTISVGTIYGQMAADSDYYPTIIGTASISRKKGAVTAVTPQITVSNVVIGVLAVELQEKVVAKDKSVFYNAIDITSAEMDAFLTKNGMKLMNAKNTTSSILFQQDKGYTTIKSGGYIALQKVENVGAKLTYTDSQGAYCESNFMTFADVVTEINNLKTKRDYTIILNDAMEDISANAAKTLTMPNKNYISSLVIESASGSVVELSHAGNITLTSPTILRNVKFVKAGANTNPAAIKVSAGGYALTIDGEVIFNTPVTFDGGKKGTLEVTTNGQLYTLTNGMTPVDELEQLICGGITNFAEVKVHPGQVLTLREFGVLSSKEKISYTAGTFNVTTLDNEGEVRVVGDNKAGAVTIANAELKDGHLYSNGTMNITNMTLDGDVIVRAEKDFNIKGKVVSKTENAAFYANQKSAKNAASYLNITGTVTLEDASNKIKVGLYGAVDTELKGQKVVLESGKQLFAAKSATVEMFVADGDNVGNVEVYGDDNEKGYILKKAGTNISVFYGDEVAVELCDEAGDVIGYYTSFAEAVSAIEAFKDKTAEYEIVLLEDVNAEKPAAITLPKTAGKVIITSKDEQVFNLYYTGNLSLKTNTEFVQVCLNPMNTKKQGVALNIAGGKFDLTLRNVEIGNVSGMAVKDITAKELVVENVMPVKGNVKATTIIVENGTSTVPNVLDVTGTFTTDKLVLQGYAEVKTANTTTIKDIVNEKTNTIHYVKNLTVNGKVSGSNETDLCFNLVADGKAKSDYVLKMDSKNVKYVLNASQKLATIKKEALSEMNFSINGILLDENATVKANSGIYVIDTNSSAGASSVLLSADGYGSSYCLDIAQAMAEINTLADKTENYEVKIGTGITDANITDNSAKSALAMPKANMAASVTIKADSKTTIPCTGNISYAGNLAFENVALTVQKISSVKELVLSNTALTTTDTVSVTNVKLVGAPEWNAVAKTTVTNVDASKMTGGYIGTKQTAKTLLPMFTINGNVTLNAAKTPVMIKVMGPASKGTTMNWIATYKGVSLVVAPKENADRFVAYPFNDANIGNNTEDMVKDNLKAYKTTKNEVVNGNWSEMVVRIIQTKDGVTEETYAKSFDEAVTIINNMNDMTADYRMELLQGAIDNPLKTTKSGTAYGAMTLPSKAKSVTIVGCVEKVDEEETIIVPAAIYYTGTLKVNCNTRFENVTLTEGTVSKSVFTAKHQITPSYTGAYELTFGAGTHTAVSDGTVINTGDLKFASVNVTKGKVTFEDTSAYVVGDLKVKDLEIRDNDTENVEIINVEGKTTITNLVITDNEATNADTKLCTKKATAITNISGNETLCILSYFTTTTKATQKSVMQLAINGEIQGVEVQIVPYIYNFATKAHETLSAENADGMKVASMTKASIKMISVAGWNEYLYKQDAALYLSSTAPVVKVVAEDYESDFLTWEQAVKEIDKRANNKLSYQMILLEDIGVIKTLTLPSKAKEVVVTSENGEVNHVLFTTNKITLKSNTTFENVGLFAVKKVKNSTAYDSIAYSVAAGSYALELCDLQGVDGEYEAMISAMSGSSKGKLTLIAGNDEDDTELNITKITGFATVEMYNEEQDEVLNENQVQSNISIPSGMTGIGTLKVYPGVVFVSNNGVVTAKNVDIYGATIAAKDITVSQTATLESANLRTGTKANNDGKLKLKDIVVEDNNNTFEAKQDKNGKSQITVSGTVKAGQNYSALAEEAAIRIALYYNNYSRYAQLYNGMVLLTAAKAESTWFGPFYTTYDSDEDCTVQGMGYKANGYGVYKQKKDILYGAVSR